MSPQVGVMPEPSQPLGAGVGEGLQVMVSQSSPAPTPAPTPTPAPSPQLAASRIALTQVSYSADHQTRC